VRSAMNLPASPHVASCTIETKTKGDGV